MPNNLVENNIKAISFASPKIKDLAKVLQVKINPEYIDAYNNFKKVAKSIQEISVKINKIISQVAPIAIPKINSAINNFLTNTRIIKGHWIVIDDELFNMLKTKDSIEDITKTIVDYYTENKYEKLIKIFNEIEALNIIPERMHILKSCMQIIKSSSQKHAYNIVIPTLMAQATGIIEEDCVKLIPENILIKKEDGHKVSGARELLNALEKFDCNILFYEMFNSAINNGLFKNINKSDYENYKRECGSNRHKILHGEQSFLDYGTKENLIRTCLDLYLLCFTKLFLNHATKELEVINAR